MVHKCESGLYIYQYTSVIYFAKITEVVIVLQWWKPGSQNTEQSTLFCYVSVCEFQFRLWMLV